jgi:hypothetical protein
MRYVLAVLAALSLSACQGEDPTQPSVNINGDHNQVSVPRGDGNSHTTPAPVVVPPVIVAPEAEDEG